MKIAMICSCGKRSMDMPPILDVEKVLQDFAWKDFKEKTGTVEKLFLRRREYEVDVPMNYFHFEDSETVLKPRPSSIGHMSSGTSVLSTHFRNNTNTSQTYKFRIERTRKATLSVTFQRGFCVGGKAQFKLRLPNVFGEGNEIDMRLHISKTTGETFDETVTFEANSDINVEENCNYTANVAFTEKEISAEFMIQTLMRMPNGMAPVFIRRKRDHELQATVFINDLKDVFSDYTTVAAPVEEISKDGKIVRHAIKFITTGIIEGMRLSGQTIYLDSMKIPKRNVTDSERISASALVAEVVARSGLFDVEIPSTSEGQREDLASVAHQPETRILKAPQIPTIITTAPSSQETSPPSEAGTSISLESQSIPDIKAEARVDVAPCPTIHATHPSKPPSSGSSSRQGSVDKDISSHPLPRQPSSSVTPACRPMSRRDSRDASSRSPSKQSHRDVEYSSRPPSRRNSKDTESMSRPPSRQTSRDTESMSRQTSRDIEAVSRPPSRQASRDTESMSRQTSRDIEAVSRPPSRQSSRDIESISRPPSRQSSRDIESISRPPSRQSSRDIESISRPPSRQSSIDIESISRPPSRQTSREFDSMSRQTSKDFESILKAPSRQTAKDTEANVRPLSRQESKDTESKSRPPSRQTSKDHESNTLPLTKQPSTKGKEKTTLKQTRSLSRGSKDEATASFHEVKFHSHSQKVKVTKQESLKKRESSKDTLDTPRTKPESHRARAKSEPSAVPPAEGRTKQTASNPSEVTDVGLEMRREASDRPYIRQCLKHETLERLERVSSLSDERRVVYRSGSLPRSSPQPPSSPPRSIEAQSSEEDSTASLSKLAKCTSV